MIDEIAAETGLKHQLVREPAQAVKSAIRIIEIGGEKAIITSLDNALESRNKTRGTAITK
ncbi:MAG: hypothetical protein ACFFCP_11690 [Promethearchaeota archaeon]